MTQVVVILRKISRHAKICNLGGGGGGGGVVMSIQFYLSQIPLILRLCVVFNMYR